MSEHRVQLYTDGAYSSKSLKGGWAYHIIHDFGEFSVGGMVDGSTNNRMEMLAVIKGLEMIDADIPVSIFTDSMYVLNGATKWYDGWIRSGRTDFKNPDLWLEMKKVMVGRDLIWKHVKAHNGDRCNEICDKLAVSYTKI